LKPDVELAHIGLGAALGDKGDWDGAIAEFRDVTRLKPEEAGAHFNLGLALEGKGQLQASLAEYQKAYELAPNDQHIRGKYERMQKQLNK
jgi:Flp pilus assembly protein TadD